MVWEGDQDETCVELLRDGLSLLERSGFPVRTHTAMILLALYVSVAASDEEPMSELSERASAWALGLPEDSPLVPIVDTVLVATSRELDPIQTLGHLFMIPAFQQPPGQEDRRWHSGPGTDFVPLALEMGYRHVKTSSLRVVRVSAMVAASIEGHERRLEERRGHPLEPDDLVLADFENGEPVLPDAAQLVERWEEMFDLIDLHPAWRHAYLRENARLPLLDGTFVSKRDRREWQAAVDRYVRQHPEDGVPKHKAELGKLRRLMGLLTFPHARHDPVFARRMIALLDGDPVLWDDDLDEVAGLLEAMEAELVTRFDEDPDFRAATLEYVRQLDDQAFVERLAGWVPSAAHDVTDHASLLFVLAVVLFVPSGAEE